MTNEQHNKYIAFTFLGHAGFQLLMLLFMVAIFSTVIFLPPEPGRPAPPTGIFAVMIAFVSIFYLAFTIPSLVAAYGLLKRKSWARIAAIIAGAVSSMNVPIGTAACVYALWFFLGDNWKSVYPEKAGEVNGDPKQIASGQDSRFSGTYETADRERFRTYEPPDWR